MWVKGQKLGQRSQLLEPGVDLAASLSSLTVVWVLPLTPFWSVLVPSPKSKETSHVLTLLYEATRKAGRDCSAYSYWHISGSTHSWHISIHGNPRSHLLQSSTVLHLWWCRTQHILVFFLHNQLIYNSDPERRMEFVKTPRVRILFVQTRF